MFKSEPSNGPSLSVVRNHMNNFKEKIMPKVTINSKGCVESGGTGLVVDSSVAFTTSTSVSAAGSLDATTFLTVATAAIAGDGLVLPASAETGALKLILSTTDDDVLLKGTNATTGDLTLTNKGAMAWCVYNGTEWVIGRSL